MAIVAKDNGGIEPIAAGMYVARCVSMIHIGSIKETYEGVEKVNNKVMIGFELPTVLHTFDEDKGPEVRLISKEYTLSIGKKANLLKDINSWRGVPFTDEEAAAFDITKLLGVPCMIQVLHKTSKKGKVRAEINLITPLAAGSSAPEQVYPNFEFNYQNVATTFKEVPEWIQKKIVTSEEFAKSGFKPESATPTQATPVDNQEAEAGLPDPGAVKPAF